jgi:hypothetical protein
MKRFLKQSEISRYITKGDRGGIRFPEKVPAKHIEALDKLFLEEIPAWWNDLKSQLADKPKAGGQKNKNI